MRKIEFYKMHGLGNDFVIIDRRKNFIKIDKNIVKKLSNRKTGPGCDQVITIDKSKNSNHDVSIQIHNSNGDIAEACGNGTRCVAKLVFQQTKLNKIKIKSLAGTLTAKKINKNMIRVNLGKISHQWKDIPLSKKVDTLKMPLITKIPKYNSTTKYCTLQNIIAVNIGNPHVVFFGKKIKLLNLEKFGPKIEKNKLFPKKTNVEIVEIINRKKIKMRVWERGVGITLACGSGACASVYASSLIKLTNKKVEVKLEKGSLYIEIKNNEAIMNGPAEISYKGFIKV